METTGEWTKHVLSTTPSDRKQIQLHIARTAGAVRGLIIQQVPTSPNAARLETMLTLELPFGSFAL